MKIYEYAQTFEYRIARELIRDFGSIPVAVETNMMADALGGYVAQEVKTRTPVVVDYDGEIIWRYGEGA